MIWANQLKQPRNLTPVPGTPKSLTPSQVAPGRQMNHLKKETASKPPTPESKPDVIASKPDNVTSTTQKTQETKSSPLLDKKLVCTLPVTKITLPTKSGTDSKKKRGKVHMGTDKLLSLVSLLTRKDSRRVRPVDLSCWQSFPLSSLFGQ